MEHTAITARYLQIAQDLAARIAKEELPVGSRIYGRSVMASEYNTSPETVRRALRLLADMKVVEIKPQSGAVVLSADSARRYAERFRENTSERTLRKQLREMMTQYDEMNRKLTETVAALIRSKYTFDSVERPFPNYEVPVPADSPLIGKSIGALKFWQRTGGTVVAIRRGQSVILSPGPYAELYGGDVILLVGMPDAAEAANRLVTEKEDIEIDDPI
ncbi:MAG: TrkA C-terminal domain-containing protein [Oscillospiraceae bacterium]|nr:TrkA C-terminal domain-containing protein [Oscillospiraceae bacterium]